MRILSEISENI